MTFQILFAFDKHQAWPEVINRDKETGQVTYRGYDPRPKIPLTGITIHSTEHQPGQTADDVWAFLRDSDQVSIHYGIGADGVIQRVLDPGPWRAWHAGESSWRGRPECNAWMVGIELYHRAGHGPYPAVQLTALTLLCRVLMVDHPTIAPGNIVMHRWIAVPDGRKEDATDWGDADFRQWVTRLSRAPLPHPATSPAPPTVPWPTPVPVAFQSTSAQPGPTVPPTAIADPLAQGDPKP